MYRILNDGNKMPFPGFGTWHIVGNEGIQVFKAAIMSGFRHFDTAEAYNNEKELGIAINQCIQDGIIKREDLFVTTKINPHNPIGYSNTLKAFENSLKRLGLDYVDLYLIHWPNLVEDDSWKNLNAQTWRAMEELKMQGKISSLGVSNFMIHHLEELLKTAKIMPSVNQINHNPTWQQKELVEYCKQKGIQCAGWAPIVRIKPWNKEVFTRVSEKYNKSIPQICLRYCIQKGVVPISSSKKPDHMRENLDIMNFEISSEDMNLLDSLNSHPWDHDSQPDCLYEIFRLREKLSEKKIIEKECFYLFNFIKLIEIKNISNKKKACLLFGKIPILQLVRKNQGESYKCYIFNFIRVGTFKQKSHIEFTRQLPVYKEV